MMIYTTNGFKQQRYNHPQGDDWQHFINSVANPPQFNGDDVKAYKATQAPYAVYGHNKDNELHRGESELLTRSILFIDVDNGGSDYQTTRERINNALEAFDISHVIYPTLSHGIKQGERLRLGVHLDTPLQQADYIKLWLVLVVNLQIIADLAGVTKSFKQLQGLYVQTPQNAHITPDIANNKPLNTSKFLHEYEKDTEKYENYLNRHTTPSVKLPQSTHTDGETPRWAINNQLRFNALTDPEGHYMDFGGWDNMLTQIGGWVFNQTHGDFTATANVIEHVNNLGSDPIPEAELVDKFKNWARKWRY